MNEPNYYLLSTLTAIPVLGSIIVSMLGKSAPGIARRVALVFSFVPFLLVLALLISFNPSGPRFQFVERYDWIPSLGVQYFVAVDGLGLLMVLLSAIVVPFALAASGEILEKPHGYYALMLLLEAGLFGAFTALNFFHWFIFWELILVPAYFLIKLWGGPGRTPAATQFFLYTLVGSVAMLLGFVAIYLSTGSFDFIELAARRREVTGGLAVLLRAKAGWGVIPGGVLPWLVFAGIFLGFAVKVPLMPFHTWAPGAYAEAPAGVSMVLTGTMSKMGVYGFLRILLPLFPEQMRVCLAPLLGIAVATIIFSALAAFAQRDLKRLFAYSSINHLGYCLLGIFAAAKLDTGAPQSPEYAAALNGVLLQMFNHGITASALFCFVGYLEGRSGGARGLGDFGGLRKAAPVFCGLMGIAMFASLGLPGLNGFVSEFLIFKGAFALVNWAAGLSVLGLLMTAVFLLTILQRVFSGPLAPPWSGFADLTLRERIIVAPAIGLIFLVGIYPQVLLYFTNPGVRQLAAPVMP